MLYRKKGIVFVCLILGFLFSSCATAPTFTTATLEPLVSFHKLKDEEKLPVDGAIYIPEDFIKKMPVLTGNDPNLWPWFFKKGIESVFEKAEVFKNLEEIKSFPKVKVIVKPELWGFYFQRYYGTWTCWLDFKFRFLDKNGNTITSISADGKSLDSDRLRALATVMNEVVEKFQKNIARLEREKILSKSLRE